MRFYWRISIGSLGTGLWCYSIMLPDYVLKTVPWKRFTTTLILTSHQRMLGHLTKKEQNFSASCLGRVVKLKFNIRDACSFSLGSIVFTIRVSRLFTWSSLSEIKSDLASPYHLHSPHKQTLNFETWQNNSSKAKENFIGPFHTGLFFPFHSQVVSWLLPVVCGLYRWH